MTDRQAPMPIQPSLPDQETAEDRHDARRPRPVLRLRQALWLGIALTVFCLRYPLATISGVSPLVISLGVVVLLFIACSNRGGSMAWATYVVGVEGFESLRSVVTQLGFPVHAGDIRQLEQSICFGVIPTSVLQHAFLSPAGLGAIDYVAVAVHGSYFVAPYIVLAAVWGNRPSDTARLTIPLLGTLGVGLALNAALPSMPPWLGSSYLGTSDVQRILYLVTQSVVGSSRQVGESLGDPNPTACLPSLHFAVTFVLFLYVGEQGRLLRYAGAVYCLAMALSLIYLGEHYLVDCILGGVVAFSVSQASRGLPQRLPEGALE